ncbi:MAG: hypothetical protein KKE17_02240 [Proteobacteria bacterium]|nr:hypothetical protein [Pseudomonadota bacterium]MBU1708800.1 hypothetical protein [Pseudomonadota bacterium]
MNKQKPKKDDVSFWDQHRGVINARKGGWVPGEAIYNQGYSMMEDLVGKVSFFQVLVLNITGRMIDRKFAEWIDNIYICMSWPDSRIWCNQVSTLAGTMRTTPVAAVCAGILAADSPMYGSAPVLAGSQFIREALIKKQKGMTAEEIVKEQQRRPSSPPVITGYARPVAKGDERVIAMKMVTEKLGFEIGDHLKLGFEIERVLESQFDETMNICGYVSAFFADQGFSPHECYQVFTAVVYGGTHACYAEALEQPPGSFFPLRCEDIDYQGKPPRPVPEHDED